MMDTEAKGKQHFNSDDNQSKQCHVYVKTLGGKKQL